MPGIDWKCRIGPEAAGPARGARGQVQEVPACMFDPSHRRPSEIGLVRDRNLGVCPAMPSLVFGADKLHPLVQGTPKRDGGFAERNTETSSRHLVDLQSDRIDDRGPVSNIVFE